jgi:hypothetical protein
MGTPFEMARQVVDACSHAGNVRPIPVRLNPTQKKQYDEDDQDSADHANAAVTVSVSVSSEAATKATKQKDDKDDDKDQANRHGLFPVAALAETLNYFALGCGTARLLCMH